MSGGDEVDIEARLRDEVARLRSLTDEIPALLAYWDATQHCQFANRAYLTWFGVSAEAMVGISMRQLLGPIYALNLPYIEGALRGEPQTFERVIPDPHGGPPRYSLARYVPHVVDETTLGFFVLVSDVSTQERRFRAMMDATPIPYALNDAQLNITYVNHEFVRVFGYTLAEIPTVDAWWPLAYPDEVYRAWVSSEWTRRIEVAQRERRPFEPFEAHVRAKDGTIKTVRAHASSLGGEMSGTSSSSSTTSPRPGGSSASASSCRRCWRTRNGSTASGVWPAGSPTTSTTC
ncbi:MAG: PAS domain S-box protein [Proteobacteria bacterium]|nr:PAS domain S-box protein [Pseudomonadota bacterium]